MDTTTNTFTDLKIRDDMRSPRYMQIFSTLRQWITQGNYATGARLEPEKQLCDMFGVSRITIRKALELLAHEGLIESIQGKGTFVTHEPEEQAVRANMNQRIDRARQLARNSDICELSVGHSPATPEIRKDLQLSDADEVHKISYVRVLRNSRIGYVESFHPASLDIEISADDFFNNTLLTILEDKGLDLSGIDHLVGATLADTQLARHLNINVGEPLVRVRMVMLDRDRKPVQRVIAWFRADQYEHHIFLAR